MWDVVVTREMLDRHDGQLRAVLTLTIAERLPKDKQLLRVVAWSPNAGCLFTPLPSVRRYAVAYEVRLAA